MKNQNLLDLEDIKQLKARYCRLLDTKDWTNWRDLFTDDFISDTTGSGGSLVEGADAFIAFVRQNLGDAGRVTVHQVHAPEIVLLSESSASGIWALNDIIRFAPGFTYVGYGHYHEIYEKRDGQWRIRSSRLTRLRDDIETPIFKFRIPDWLKNGMSKSMAKPTNL